MRIIKIKGLRKEKKRYKKKSKIIQKIILRILKKNKKMKQKRIIALIKKKKKLKKKQMKQMAKIY